MLHYQTLHEATCLKLGLFICCQPQNITITPSSNNTLELVLAQTLARSLSAGKGKKSSTTICMSFDLIENQHICLQNYIALIIDIDQFVIDV